MRARILKGIVFFFLMLTFSPGGNGQVSKEEFDQLRDKVEKLESENNTLKNNMRVEIDDTKRKVEGYAPMFLLLFLYGTVCALWAQWTDRSAITWFFLGLIFSIFTAFAVMYINGKELSDND